jgi:hypothetical protein
MYQGLKILPGFTAGESTYPPRSAYASHGRPYAFESHASAEPIVPRRHSDTFLGETKVIPQQECFDHAGNCTGFWPFYRGRQCVTGFSGTRQCCTSASTYPVIRECQLPDGSFEVVNQYCGYCWW